MGKKIGVMDNMAFKIKADFLKGLAHPIRLQIIEYLKNGEAVKEFKKLFFISISSGLHGRGDRRYCGLAVSHCRWNRVSGIFINGLITVSV